MAKDNVESVTEDEQNTQDDSERSKYWDEAVSVRQDGKEPPQEPETPVEKEPEPVEEEEETDSEPEDGDETEDPSEEDAEEVETDEDPWSKAPEALRKEFEETKARYEHDIRSQRGRVGALQKQLNDLSRKLEETTTKKESPAGSDEAQDPADSLFKDEKWKKFKEDFGDVADPIEQTMKGLYQALHSRLQDTDMVSKRLQSAEDEREWAAQAAILEEEWPGWRDLVETNREDFDSFVGSRKTAMDLFNVNKDTITDSEAAITLLSRFQRFLDKKKGNGATNPATSNGEAKSKPEPRPLTPKQKAQLKSAATVAPRSAPGSGRRSSDLPDPDDQAAAWEYFAAKATR